ncbi:MAG TPA: hypothetical protein VFE62_12925 [Gemmataceae bacterium]|nr:hypothetical protein [Gemmataceae bacterium]
MAFTEVPQLLFEIQALTSIHGADPGDEEFIRDFESQLRDLVLAALHGGKPIVF